jgi:YhcG PDDEXK nuclease domain
MREEWEAPAIGILLCAEKNDAVVRYTLSEGEQQIFASRYQLYLPSEQELTAELNRERELLALRGKIERAGES